MPPLTPHELQFGYSRAVRKGPHIFVSGATSVDPETGYVRYPESAYLPALVIFEQIINSIKRLRGSKEDVARVRMFVTEREDTEAVGSGVEGIAMGDVRPAATMIVGVRFVDKDTKVEIEADAIVLGLTINRVSVVAWTTFSQYNYNYRVIRVMAQLQG